MSHEHEHTHSHAHTHGEPISPEQSKALLAYMLDHNKHHAEELHMAGHGLEDAGNVEAANLIFEAVHDFEHGNEKLAKAIATLD